MFHCSHCDAQSLKWQGRCNECGKWGTLQEANDGASGKTQSKKGAHAAPLINLGEAKGDPVQHHPTGISELDRVLGGGIVPGGVTLLAGEPGIGKSTLVAQMASALKSASKNVLYVSGEESEGQILMRLKRLNISTSNLSFSNSVEIEGIIAAAENLKPSLLIVDSIQTMMMNDVDAIPGSPKAVRAATATLIGFAKRTHIPVLMIGQVTKEGSVAGPKTLEHLVDTVLTLEGDKHGVHRILRATKHRFGTTDEIGIFEMDANGLLPVQNPSAKFLEERQVIAGSVVTCVLEGTRPLLVEVQALVEKSTYPNPLRKTSGYDSGRLQMLIAIVGKQAGIKLADKDVYVNVVGGLKLKDPSVDLAVCAALISSAREKPTAEKSVYLGELGLGGEVRSIMHEARRIKEAQRLGFNTILSPKTVRHVKDI